MYCNFNLNLYLNACYYVANVCIKCSKAIQNDPDDESDEGYEESDPLTNIDRRLSSVSVTADQSQVRIWYSYC